MPFIVSHLMVTRQINTSKEKKSLSRKKANSFHGSLLTWDVICFVALHHLCHPKYLLL